MEKHTKNKPRGIKLIPWYGWLGGIIFITLELVLYKIASIVEQNTIVATWSFSPFISGLDDKIPFVPYFFIEIYFLSYGFWLVAPIIISMRGKKNFINFMIYGTIAALLGFLFFCLVPTHLDRANTPTFDLSGYIDNIKTPLTKALVTSIYQLDSVGDLAPNLSPSYHVIFTLLCSLGVLRRKDFHLPTRICFHTLTILILLSTMFVKQHFFFDVLAGSVLTLIVYLAVKFWDPATRILNANPNFLIIQKLNWKQEKIVPRKRKEKKN